MITTELVGSEDACDEESLQAETLPHEEVAIVNVYKCN